MEVIVIPELEERVTHCRFCDYGKNKRVGPSQMRNHLVTKHKELTLEEVNRIMFEIRYPYHDLERTIRNYKHRTENFFSLRAKGIHIKSLFSAMGILRPTFTDLTLRMNTARFHHNPLANEDEVRYNLAFSAKTKEKKKEEGTEDKDLLQFIVSNKIKSLDSIPESQPYAETLSQIMFLRKMLGWEMHLEEMKKKVETDTK